MCCCECDLSFDKNAASVLFQHFCVFGEFGLKVADEAVGEGMGVLDFELVKVVVGGHLEFNHSLSLPCLFFLLHYSQLPISNQVTVVRKVLISSRR